MEQNFYMHYLKDSFLPLASKYSFGIRLMGRNPEPVEDERLVLFLFFEAPGVDFGIDTETNIKQVWELINFVDEAKLEMDTMSLDLETGMMQKATDRYFVFQWHGEYNTSTTLTVNDEIFLEFLNDCVNQVEEKEALTDAIKHAEVLDEYFQPSSSTKDILEQQAIIKESVFDNGNIEETTSFLRRGGIRENLELLELSKRNPDKYGAFASFEESKEKEEWELKFLESFRDLWKDEEFRFSNQKGGRDTTTSVVSTGEFSTLFSDESELYDDNTEWMLCKAQHTQESYYIKLSHHKDAVLIPDEIWMLKSKVKHIPG
jgi:hypothetical protein